MTLTSLPAFTTPAVKVVLGTIIVACALVGLPILFVTINYLRNAVSSHGQAINRLMYFEYLINALNMVTLTSQFLVLALPFPLGRVACTALEFLVIHDGLHRVFGGLGMALFRSEIPTALNGKKMPC